MMKINTNLIFIILIIVCFTTISVHCSSGSLTNAEYKRNTDKQGGEIINGLQLSIKSAKKVYEAGDSVTLKLRVSNVGQNKIVVAWIKFHMLFHVLGAKGYRFDTNHLKNLDYEKSDLVVILPGESKERTFVLPSVHDNTQFNKVPGEYEIFATFEPWEDGKKFGLEAWTGVLTSNSIKIKIKKWGRTGGVSIKI
jgi:hypothetical protein